MIIFQGEVDRAGKIGQLECIEGKKSDYTNKVRAFLTEELVAWIPRFDGSGKRPWPVRISVRVINDHSLKISIR